MLAIGLFAAAVAALYITVKSCIQSFRAVKKALRIIQRHGCKAGLKFLVKAASESKVVKIGCVGPVLVLCVYNPFGCGLCTLIRIRLRNRRLDLLPPCTSNFQPNPATFTLPLPPKGASDSSGEHAA